PIPCGFVCKTPDVPAWTRDSSWAACPDQDMTKTKTFFDGKTCRHRAAPPSFWPGQGSRREPQGTVGCRTASLRAWVRKWVNSWYSGSATMRLNASRLG